jgi:hypothetical protein
METTRRDFGTTISTLARLYVEAERSGDARRAKAYAAAVDVLLDAWPSEPARLGASQSSELELQGGASSVPEETLIGLGAPPDGSPAHPTAPVSGLHRRAERASGGVDEPSKRSDMG